MRADSSTAENAKGAEKIKTLVTVRFYRGKFVGRCRLSRVISRKGALDAAKKVAVKAQGLSGRTGNADYFDISGISLTTLSPTSWIAEWEAGA